MGWTFTLNIDILFENILYLWIHNNKEENIMDTKRFYSKFFICGKLLLSFILLITILSGNGFAQLSGNYTVGAGGDYTTLKAAANDLMNQGVSGPVTMNVLSGTYTEHFVLNTITGTSVVNTVTFQSAAGHPDSVFITYNASSADSNYVVKMDNVQFLNFQSLTFHANGQYYSRIFYINATQSTTGNITINNNIFHGDSLSSNSINRTIIFSYDPDVENIHILGNTFYGGSSAIFLQGLNYNFIQGTNIISNNFYNIVYCAINISCQESPVIGNNFIESNQYGIRVVIGAGNLQIRENKVNASHCGITVTAFGELGGDQSLIVNNFIFCDGPYGMIILNNINMDIYHNSISVINQSQGSKAFQMESNFGVSTNINIINNSFASMEAGYAYHVTYPAAINISDYNNLYSAGNFVAYHDSNIIDLEKLQSVSGKNLNSLSVYPHYTSDTDLHTIAPWLDNKGTNLNYITRDIDGESRNPVTPDIGADEFTSDPGLTPYAQDLTVGSGGDFTTLNEAIDALILRGVSDSIHINMMPGIYNEQIDLVSIPGTSEQRVLTFQSQTSDTAEITFAVIDSDSNYTIRFKGADNIRFRNLKLTAIDATYCRVIDFYRGANNDIIENCILAATTSSGSTVTKAIIFSNDSYYISRVIRNNKIDQGTYGIYMRRDNSNDVHAFHPVISNNRIINNGYCGLYIQFTDYLEIIENTIQTEILGMWIIGCHDQSKINKNKIDVDSQYGLRLNSCSSDPGHPITVFNNFIHVGGSGIAQGLEVNNCYSVFIFHNSVNVTSTNVTLGRAFYLSSTSSFDINLYNNIFNNSGGGYAYYVENTGAIGTSNYNDLFTTGALLAYWLGGRVDLAALQAAGGQNLNSVSAYPLFVSNTDLHTTAAVLDSAAIYMGVPEDIDGQLRDQNFPDIGADEFGYFANSDPVITSSPYIIAQVDSLYEYQIIASDPDGDVLAYRLNSSPTFLNVDSVSGLISGTPTINDTGQYYIQIEVYDIRGGFDYQNYNLYVIATPLFTIDFAVSNTLENVYASSASWGDYDNDGDLDIILNGVQSQGVHLSKIYRNDSGIFSDINAGLTGIWFGKTIWGDYDNDNDLDILLTGNPTSGSTGYISKIYRNDLGIFTDINVAIDDVARCSAEWGDYDNDGDLDLIIAGRNNYGHQITKLFNNELGSFINTNIEFPGIDFSSISWGDYDNDGDLDIIMSGYDSASNPYTEIFRNDNASFTNMNAGLLNLFSSSTEWGDYDNDGDLDILITGSRGSGLGLFSKVYQNENGTFTDINAGLLGVYFGDASWGDYDNDGDLDILLIGTMIGSNYISRIYRNDLGVFTDINADLIDIYDGVAEWADYDNDGDLDILLTGKDQSGNPATILYRNNINSDNTLPSQPSNLNWNLSESRITFNWDAASDLETPQAGLTYNLRIGSTPGGSEIKSAMSNSNGYRQVPELGNVNHPTSWSLSNASSNIYWSVQAVDHTYLGSQFSVEHTITISGIIQSIADVPNDQGGKVTIRWQASEFDNNVNTLQHYSIWRAIPVTEKIANKQNADEKEKSLPLEENNRLTEINEETYYWEWVANQPAHRLPFYSYTCETLYDSMSTTNGMHYFMISAHTNDPNVFFDSNPDSGYSVDNLAPLAPANLNGMYNNNQITLHWSPNKESDLNEYVLFRSLTPNINPATDTVFAVTTDTAFTDTSPIPASNIYFVVCARDIHDNLSAGSNEVEILITGILKDGSEIPKTFALHQNFPNPFNPYTVIKFDLPKSSKVVVTVFNSLGKNVATIVNEPMTPGKYQYIWKPEHLASGLYFYTIQADNFRSVKKMLLVK